jgi:hypothetical protein
MTMTHAEHGHDHGCPFGVDAENRGWRLLTWRPEHVAFCCSVLPRLLCHAASDIGHVRQPMRFRAIVSGAIR